jgi:hypothetical protein
MKDLLRSVGIEAFDSFIYEFEAVQLDWWDTRYKTCIEIETHQEDEKLFVSVIFMYDTEAIVERTVVFYGVFDEQNLQEDTLLAKKLGDQLVSNVSYTFSSEHQAYLVTTFIDTQEIFQGILNLIKNKQPVYIADLDESEDDDDDDWNPEKGEALEAYIFNLSINTDDFSEEDIVYYFGMFKDFEGEVAFKALIDDVVNDAEVDLSEDEIDAVILQRIRSTLKAEIAKK